MPRRNACWTGPGPALAGEGSHAFVFHVTRASHALPCAQNRPPAPLGSGRDRRDAHRVTFMRTSAGAMRHEAQEGPIVATVRVKAQHCTSPHRSPWRWHARATVCDEQPDRPGIRGGRSPQRQQQKPSPTTCAVTREGEWCGYLGRWPGWAGERGSSALTTGAVGAAAAVVICCTICSSCTRLAGCAPR